jgi:hypothetical protein
MSRMSNLQARLPRFQIPTVLQPFSGPAKEAGIRSRARRGKSGADLVQKHGVLP